jgi:adenylate cyclase
VIVTRGVHRAVAAKFTWGAGESVEIKGRRGMETVFPVIARETSGTASLGSTDDCGRRGVADLEDNRDPST